MSRGVYLYRVESTRMIHDSCYQADLALAERPDGSKCEPPYGMTMTYTDRIACPTVGTNVGITIL